MTHAIEVDNLEKVFETKQGQLRAVDGVSFTVKKGSIHGLLGPNGAGKSTLINMISGVMRPTLGTVVVMGHDVRTDTQAAKQALGVVPQELVAEMAFTVEEVLYYYGGVFGVPVRERALRIESLLHDLSLSEKRTERARGLSGGMKRRLMIAKALMHNPDVLILDEPTAGVDVGLRQKLWELVKRLNAEGMTILFTTHYLEEAEQLCDELTLINHGKIIKQGTFKEIQHGFTKELIHFELYNRSVPHMTGVTASGVEFVTERTHLERDITAIATHYGDNLKSVRSGAASLEEIFLSLTQPV